MNDTALLGPVVMQCENEILEGHEQSSRGCGGLNSRDRYVEMNGEANRNAQDLSRNNPSRIKELQRIHTYKWMDAVDQTLRSIPLKYFKAALDVIRRSLLLSPFLIKSLGIN